MSTSELNWFIDLARSHPNAPSDAKYLANKISKALVSKHYGTAINRVFRNNSAKLPVINSWLNDASIRDAVQNKHCKNTSDAYGQTLTAFNNILKGELATKAWVLTNQMGPKTTFSSTLDANALAQYLSTHGTLNYSARKAASISAEILGVNKDEIRHYDTVKPQDYRSICAVAYSAVVRYGNKARVDKYFDLEELREDATFDTK